MKLLALIFVFYFAFIVNGQETLPKAALIPLDEQSEIVTELVLDMFSKGMQAPVSLLERAEFDKIVKEIKLNNSKFGNREFTPDWKFMENTDIFCILGSKKISTSKLAGSTLIIYDTSTGIRLADCDIVGKPAVIQATAVAKVIRLTLKKRARLHNYKLSRFAFLPLVPVNLSTKQLTAAREAESSIIRTLGKLPDSVVLERRHLRHLLNEPNAQINQLTKKLLTGSIFVKLRARGTENGKIILTAGFYRKLTGKLMVELSVSLDPTKDISKQLESFIANKKFNQTASLDGNRQDEARGFANQAFFAVQHSLTTNAVSAAESAAVLDKRQELALCVTYSQAAMKNVHNHQKLAEVLANFRGALNIAEKYNYFPFYLWRFTDEFGHSMNIWRYNRLPEKQRMEIRKLFNRYYAARHNGLKKLLIIADKGGNTTAKQLYALGRRGQYIHIMGQQTESCGSWNYTYEGKYILPQLKKYIAEMEKLTPELKKFFAMPKSQRSRIYGFSGINILERSSFGDFFNSRRMLKLTSSERKVVEQVISLLLEAPYIHIAVKGARARRNLDRKKVNHSEDEVNREVYAKFAKTMLNIFDSGKLLGNYAPNGYFDLSNDAQYIDLDTRLKIWKIATESYHYYHIFRGNVINGFKKMPFQDVKKLYKAIKHQYACYHKDPLAFRKSYVDEEFKAMLDIVEKKYPVINPKRIVIPKTPYLKIIKPLVGMSNYIRPTEPVFDGRFIIFAYLTNNSTRMVKLDTKNNFSVSLGESLNKSKGWYGRMMNGTLLDNYYAAFNGPYVMLYPLNGSKPELLNFKSYYENSNNCLTGYGERLFISYGQWAGIEKPGSLIEYNVRTKKQKLLVSTLDRSVKWPLQGMNWPYHILRLAVDGKNHRILTVIHSAPYKQGFSAPPLKLYAYNWEKGSWSALSDKLPIYFANDVRIFVEKNKVYLLNQSFSFSGFGPILPDKSWKLLVQTKKACLTSKPPVFRNGKVFNLNISNLASFPEIKGNKKKCSFINYSHGIIFAQRMLLFPTENFIFEFSKPIYPRTIIDKKYVIEWNSYSTSPDAFKICILKPLPLLKQEKRELSDTSN